MNLSEPFIRRPVMTILMTISMILFGVLAYQNLPVNDLPAVDYPVIQASVSYPGATPETMASNCATPLEKQFMQIPGLEVVTSESSQGRTSFVLQFAINKSVDGAATDVQTAITQASAALPADLPSPPIFTKNNPNDQAILYIGLTSDSMTAGQLYDIAATQVAQQISIVQGVSRVDVFGTKSAVRIKADPSAMAAVGLSVEDLATAIRSGTSYQGAGQIDGKDRSFLLQPKGQIDTAESYGELIISQKADRPIRLKDVAKAVASVQDERIDMRFWVRGKTVPKVTVVLAVFRQAGANVVEVSNSILALQPIIEATLPPSVEIRPIYNRAKGIINSVNDVKETLYIAFGLVVFVIFIFLGRVTDTLIPAVALPLSLLLTFIAMQLLGYSLDNLSLMALTLAIGFLVDDAIVFLENTVRRMEKYNETALVASINSAKEISFTIFAMTISLAAVFIPLVFMPGLVGKIFREFSITIIVSIFASGLVSLTLTPLMCARLLKDRGHGTKKTLLERTIGRAEKAVLNYYGRSLTFFLRHKWISALLWIISMVGTVFFFTIVPKSFLPVGDSSFSFGILIGQEGSSPAQMRKFQTTAEAAMQSNPAVDMTFSMTGNNNFINQNMGILLAFMKDPKERAPIAVVCQEMMGAVMMSTPGAMGFFKPNPVLQISTGATANQLGQFAYTIRGIDAEKVRTIGRQLEMRCHAYPGFASVQTDLFDKTPSLEINVLRDQARSYGVSETRIFSLIRNAYSQNYVYLIKKPQDQYQVILEVDDNARTIPEDLGLLYIRSDDGKNMVPLRSVATWNTTVGPQKVNHFNQFASVSLYFNLKPGVSLGEATDFIDKLATEIVPPELPHSLQGEALTFRETANSLLWLMLLAVFVMYVILGVLYENIVHPLTVLSSLPVALVGGLMTLWLFNEEASLYAYVGMFMLMGIVKKNGIMVVDFALQRIREGATSIDAIHDASMDRFRPIMMTTLAAVMGAVPIALGFGADGASRRPLGLVVVGGLIVSQLITLYVTPAIYLYLENFQEKYLDRISLLRSEKKLPIANAVEVT